MKIVNQHLNFPKAALVKSNTKGYLHIGAEVDKSPFPFYLKDSKKKKKIIRNVKKWSEEIAQQPGVTEISFFKAVVIPPVNQPFLELVKHKIHVAKFDIALLIETDNDNVAVKIRQHPACLDLIKYIEMHASYTHVAIFENVRRINEVDKSRKGVFLFNHFYAEDPDVLLPVWEYTAGWFTSNTGLDNSTLLKPLDGEKSDYDAINHCRWNSLLHLMPKLMFSRSIKQYVGANFEANKIASMPILYKLIENYKNEIG